MARDCPLDMSVFANSLREGFGAVAEFKRRSPSAGDLRPDGDPAAVARGYEAAGARAMSVLVDERFAGTWEDLRAARAATSLPLLAKGFFSTAEHLRIAREAGADAALLILRDLDDAQCLTLMREADGLGLDTLVESARRRRADACRATRRTGDRDQRARTLHLPHRPPRAACAARARTQRPDRDRGVGDRDPAHREPLRNSRVRMPSSSARR